MLPATWRRSPRHSRPFPKSAQRLSRCRRRSTTSATFPGIDEAAASLPDLLDAVHRVPTIEALLVSLMAALEPALADVKRVTEIVDAQQQQVTHIEAMVQLIERRSQTLERSVVDLRAKADEAMRALPDPDDEQRGPLAKARDAITGG